jgi:hypothetical protein
MKSKLTIFLSLRIAALLAKPKSQDCQLCHQSRNKNIDVYKKSDFTAPIK